MRVCHSIYGPVPASDGVILEHHENVYNIQMHGMRGRIDAQGFHYSGYFSPTVAAPPVQSAPTEPKLQKACRNLAAILGPVPSQRKTTRQSCCWALEYHTLILFFLKGAIMKYKFILFFSLVTSKPRKDYEAIMMNQGSPSDALFSEIKALGHDYGGLGALRSQSGARGQF